MTLRILLAEDHEVVRAGFRAMLNGTAIEVIGETASDAELQQVARDREWDLAVVDLTLPLRGGFSVASELRLLHSKRPILLYAEHDYPRLISRATANGLSGILLKSLRREALIEALRKAATAKPPRPRRRPHSPIDTAAQRVIVEASLTDREQEVLRQLALGPTNREIAQNLEISYETVKEHVQHILQKIGVADRTQAAVWAVRNGLI